MPEFDPNGLDPHGLFPHETTPTPRGVGADTRRKLATVVGLVLLQAAGSVAAQNTFAPPRYGSVELEAGFTNDPYTVRITSPGGSETAQDAASDCYGHIDPAQPDFRLTYDAGINRLGIFVDSEIDTTLIISDPDGTWHCNDDSWNLENANPGVTIESPRSGNYDIWVGTFNQGDTSDVTILAITEADDVDWLGLNLGVQDILVESSYDAGGNVIFGDDSSMFANDGECDDDRFEGQGVSMLASATHRFHDATDCRRSYDDGSITLFGRASNTSAAIATGERVASRDIDFGDNSSVYANDGECDDPRFEGPGSAGVTLEDDRLRDAVDCRSLYEQGQIVLRQQVQETVSSYAVSVAGDIDFGDNSSMWANDGECDDPRFEGPGVSLSPASEDSMRDASDCRTLFERGSISLAGTMDGISSSIPSDIPPGAIFASTRPNPSDARPSDPAPIFSRNTSNVPDNSAGTRILNTTNNTDSSSIDFGDNSSAWADDGECDDPRFEGPGSAAFTIEDDRMHDAADCRMLFNAGLIELAR